MSCMAASNCKQFVICHEFSIIVIENCGKSYVWIRHMDATFQDFSPDPFPLNATIHRTRSFCVPYHVNCGGPWTTLHSFGKRPFWTVLLLSFFSATASRREQRESLPSEVVKECIDTRRTKSRPRSRSGSTFFHEEGSRAEIKMARGPVQQTKTIDADGCTTVLA